MKRILTLLVAIVAVFSVQAQTSSREEARRVILGTPGTPSRTGDVVYDRNGNPTYPNSSRQAEIDRVNREYDSKIYSIRNNPNLSNEEKQRMISQLERDRQQRIREINNRYGNGQYNERTRERKDNGKHLGWEKGRGNPHRTGAWKGDDDRKEKYKQNGKKGKKNKDR